MSDYEDYGEEGYGEDDYDREYSGEDEDEKGYREYDDDNIVEFSFKDIGADARVGGPMDEDLDLPMGTQDVFDIRTKAKIEPDVLFKLEVANILKRDDLGLTADNKSTIKKNIKKMNMIKYKNPLTYVFGFYIATDMRSNNYIDNRMKEKIKYVKQNIQTEEDISMQNVIKYARWWRNILV
jgi:hypothetical protein